MYLLFSCKGIVHKWQEYRYQAYEMIGDMEQQKQLARELLFTNEFTYYLKLKELYPANEWDAALNKIVDDFKKMKNKLPVYLSILKEENLTAELLTYCQSNTRSIIDLYPYIIKDYLEEVNKLFIQKSSGKLGKLIGDQNYAAPFRNLCF